jgi:hypothetical protein
MDSPDQTQLTLNERFERLSAHCADTRGRVPIPRSPNFSRADVVTAISSVFELIGGVPRFAVWAHENETEYYRIYAKLMPSQQQVNLTVSQSGEAKVASLAELNELAARMANGDYSGMTFDGEAERCEDTPE